MRWTLVGPVDLDHHGDDDLDPRAVDGQLDLAVNVRLDRPPAWLQARLQVALAGLAAYPRPEAAVAAVAARHGRVPAQVLLTNGAAEAFTLLARGLRPRRAVCVHPSFTAPEAALRAAGHPVRRVLLHPLRPRPRPGAGRRRPGRARQPDQPDGPPAPGRRPGAPGPPRPRPGGRRSLRRRRRWRAGVGGRPPGPPRPGRGPQPDQDLGPGRAQGRLPARRPGARRPAGRRPAAVAGQQPRSGGTGRLLSARRGRVGRHPGPTGRRLAGQPGRRARPAPRRHRGPRGAGAVPAAAGPGRAPGPGPPAGPGHRGSPGRHLPRPGPRLAAHRRGRPRAPRPHPGQLLPEPVRRTADPRPGRPARLTRLPGRPAG